MAVISEPETYSVATPPSFSDVEVTPHDGYITMTINGVDFNLKTAASVQANFILANGDYLLTADNLHFNVLEENQNG